MTQSKHRRRSTLPKSAIRDAEIWLIGDKYYERATLGSARRRSAANGDRVFAGGVWYVKKFLEQSKVGDLATLRTYREASTPPARRTVAATCTFAFFPRKSPSSSARTLRIKQSGPCKLTRMEITPLSKDALPKKLLVIEDMNIRYRVDGADEWRSILANVKKRADIKPYSSPYIAVLLGGELPALTDARFRPGIDPPDTELWNTLLFDHAQHTVVIVNADLLRFMGVNISRRVSWERTAQDFVTELQCHPQMQRLGTFAHLIVRFGVTATIHCYKQGGNVHRRFFYDSTAHDGIYRDVPRDGGVIGHNTVFLASIITDLLTRSSIPPADRINGAIKAAIPACQRLHYLGYPEFDSASKEDWLEGWPSKSVFDPQYREAKQGTTFKDYSPTSSKYIRIAEIPSSVGTWSIIRQEAAGATMMKLAEQIVFRGLRNAFNLPEVQTNRRKPSDSREKLLKELYQYHGPTARFGDLIAVDREEIESFRGVFNVIKHYTTCKVKRPNDLGPLCIAVFGPPGSGKSFVVKQIAKKARSGAATQSITINLAQISSLDELCAHLSSALPTTRKVDMSVLVADPKRLFAKIARLNDFPLIFFDEFDCDLNGKRLGWLKAFLGPMEDGIFGPAKGDMALLLHHSIFVFAGGTKRTYRDFSGEDESLSDEERLQFEIAKGPDFVSRLRGHINMKGIDRVSSSDTVFLLRRALMLRQHLKDSGLIVRNEFGENEAQIDYSVIHAMLHATSYKHGARSIKALIATCSPLEGRIEKASLPAPKLLDMHVNNVEFHDMLAEYKPQADDPKPKEQTYRLT